MVPEWRRVSISFDAFFVYDAIQLEGCDPWSNMGCSEIENFAPKLCSAAHTETSQLLMSCQAIAKEKNANPADFAQLDDFFRRTGPTLTLVDEGDLLAERDTIRYK